MDHRVEEAQAVLQKMSQYDTSIRVTLYQGNILWEQGKPEEALAVWNGMVEQNPEDWLAEFSLADGLAKAGQYREAIGHYETAYEKQPSPKYTDAFDSCGQIYEFLGEKEKAVLAYQKAIDVLRKEWHVTEGKAVDDFQQRINELEK